jgi:hypothetical protein
VHVGLGVGTAYASRGLGGQPVPVNALIDTGASQSAVAPRLLKLLGPQRIGNVPVSRPSGGTVWLDTFLLRLWFEPDMSDRNWLGQGRWFDIEVVPVAPATPGTDALIGIDLLCQIFMYWDGPGREMTLFY